jgi:hypothetical protein
VAFEKERAKEEAIYIEDTQRLVAEIEMLKVILRLVRRDKRARSHKQITTTLEAH